MIKKKEIRTIGPPLYKKLDLKALIIEMGKQFHTFSNNI
jgi:hypothetical protein